MTIKHAELDRIKYKYYGTYVYIELNKNFRLYNIDELKLLIIGYCSGQNLKPELKPIINKETENTIIYQDYVDFI